MVTAATIIQRYLDFFEQREHKRIPNAPLVPLNDPTTLFTSSGMQPLVPYLLGEPHPQGTRLVNVQNSFRAQDIDEIGDNRHTTFFRMLGNWSLGDYFKKEQLSWLFTFLTDKNDGLGLDPKRLYVTVFAGDNQIPKDEESVAIWKKLFTAVGIKAKEGERIFAYGVGKNWWSRSGTPDKMPAGELGGSDSEVFYDFGAELKIHENSSFKKEKCHPNCDCGRFMEIGNSVFMQYKKRGNRTFEELPNKNVDFGGGLERLLAAINNDPDIFKTNLFNDLRTFMLNKIKLKLTDVREKRIRIFLDHSQAAIFLINEGLTPGKNEQESVLRRLIRRADDQLTLLNLDNEDFWKEAIKHFKKVNETMGSDTWNTDKIFTVIVEELKKYGTVFKNLENEKQELLKLKLTHTPISLASMAAGPIIFKYQSTLGIPYSVAESIIEELKFSSNVVKNSYKKELDKHKEISRAGAQKFAGGLADHQERTIMGHTATHLLHQALRDVLGDHVHQTGSNITTERLRFDFNYDKKLTDEEIKKVETIVNEKITEDLPVHFEMMPLQSAKAIGAIGLFDDKYQEQVKIYFIGPTTNSGLKAYSVEFCGGPHVEHTRLLKKFTIIKQDNIGHGQRRIYAKVN